VPGSVTAPAPICMPGFADALGEADFARLAAFINSHAGIKMPPSKRSFLEGRLRRRVIALGFATFNDYCRHLFDGNGLSQEAVHLIDCVTTNKTDFFREPHHFDYLAQSVLPDMMGWGNGQPMRLWSAGCSNGAEPYTMAMVCEDFAQTKPQFRYEIIASDISVSMLQHASRAIYPHHEIEPVPVEMRKRYLLRNPEKNTVRIRQELRGKVSFAHINLMDQVYGLRQPMDVIFCRNLLIYFDKPTQQAVLEKLCAHLKTGGTLFLGHSESITGMDLPLKSRGATIFMKE